LIEVDAKLDGENYIVSVKDSGVGISPEVQKILFEKTSGYSTRGTANEKGTGLGLILCKEFVERNGGKIWLESELGKGSTFFFTIKKGA
jgi:signal transduction histidine kinase